MKNISVIIPTYNRANTLKRAIDSVSAQTVPVQEIVIVDDGSTDDTKHILEDYGPPVRYIYQQNKGVSAARNRGIAETSCEWIAFLDSDDEWLPRKIEQQMKILEENPNLVWCASNMEIVKQNNYNRVDIQDHLCPNRTLYFFTACMNGIFFQISGFIIRRYVLNEIGGFDTSLRISEDRDLWWKIAMRYPTIGYCFELCGRYYVDTPESLTHQNRDRSQSLQTVCNNITYAKKLNSEASKCFEIYGKSLIFDYLMRNAAREITVSTDVKILAEQMLMPHFSERIVLRVLEILPNYIAQHCYNVVALIRDFRHSKKK